MSLLVPLGLLGLISIGVLIFIYIIRPNFQKKSVSSTYIWKLSLKYKKKNIPISKVRNILIFLCQVVILTSLAFLISQPVILNKVEKIYDEKIIILDASASMLTNASEDVNATRFDRAVDKIKTEVANLTKDGYITIIYAGTTAGAVCDRATKDAETEINASLSALECTYGSADIEGAIKLAENVLRINNDAKVYLYTDTTYAETGVVEVVDVTNEDEWNVGILNASSKLESGFYTFTVDVGCYGIGQNVTLAVNVTGANYRNEETILIKESRFIDKGEEYSFVIATKDLDDEQVYKYDTVHFSVSVDDSYPYDNDFYLYGGTVPTLNVLYYSPAPTSFVTGVLSSLRSVYADRWNLNIRRQSSKLKPEEYRTGIDAGEVIDLYVFEHSMPPVLPDDGVSILINPDYAPNGLDMTFGNYMTGQFGAIIPDSNVVTGNLSLTDFFVTMYREVNSFNGFDVVLRTDVGNSTGGDPLLLVKNAADSKIAVFPFNFSMSTFPLNFDFPVIMKNLFEMYFPVTFKQGVYRVYDTVELRARGQALSVSGPDIPVGMKYDEFPAEMQLQKPGTYTFKQSLMAGKSTDNLFARIDEYESNVFRQEISLPELHVDKIDNSIDLDLALYVMIILVAVLFIEWLLYMLANA